MEEMLKKKISTTFKLHGFSLRRSVILTNKTFCVMCSVIFPFDFSNFMKIKRTKQYEHLGYLFCTHNFGHEEYWKETA
jgi:hypothetical protein